MTDARTRRTRPAVVQLSGSVASALDRRARRGRGEDTATPTSTVREYFGDDEDTPLLAMLKATPPNAQTYRGREYVHVSDVISKCLRKIILMERLKLRHPNEVITDGRGITFAIGDALHDYVTARFIKGHPSKVWAEWSCVCGATKQRGLFSAVHTKTCDTCSGSLVKHNEVAFPDDELMLTGSPDIVLYMDEYGGYYLVEIKSMAGTGWKELTRPVPDHVVQLTFYWNILRRAGWPLVSRCSILYANKEFSFKSPYKEFMIDPQAEGVLDTYLAGLAAFRIAREGGALPPRTFCSTQDSTGAKTCPVSVSCFGCD